MTPLYKSTLDEIEKMLSKGHFDQALSLYVTLNSQNSDYLDPKSGEMTRPRFSHIKNAANLARRDGYTRLQFMESVSPRLKKSLALFFGLEFHPFQNKLQQPSFFYIPDLPSKPFYDASEIDGLTDWIDKLQGHEDELLNIGKRAEVKYVGEFDNVPATETWNKLRDEWLSTHLLKEGKRCKAMQDLSVPLSSVLDNAPLAFCPPHAPEMFLSVLKAGAYIPPHYGISNCKLTVHIPLQVSEKASLTVGGQTFHWCEFNKHLVFDDSFVHSASNLSDKERAVLILDVWNPSLSLNERQAITQFMSILSKWNEGAGKLMNLDRGLG